MAPVATCGRRKAGIDAVARALGRSSDRAAHGPCPRDQINAAVLAGRKARANPVTQYGTTVFGKGHALARRRSLPAEKRSPVVIKVLEYRWSID